MSVDTEPVTQENAGVPLRTPHGPLKTLAIVSGKGGSGKTLFATTLAIALDGAGVRTILVDGDVGTGGLSYYLGLHLVNSIQVGLSELLLSRRISGRSLATRPMSQPAREDTREADQEANVRSRNRLKIEDCLQPVRQTRNIRLIPIGDNAEIIDPTSAVYSGNISNVIRAIVGQTDCNLVIIDCRGGIDADSLAVCQHVDAIILVSETDGAAIQACQNLVRILTKYSTGRGRGRLVGFVINKAFADPTQVANSSTSFFKTKYLGAIPFDFATTRRFIFGELPRPGDPFFTHVQSIVKNLFPDLPLDLPGRVWEAEDYEVLSLQDRDSVLGGRVSVAVLIIVCYANIQQILATYVPLSYFTRTDTLTLLLLNLFGALFGVVGSLDTFRRYLGRLVLFTSRHIREFFRGKLTR
jgi:septum site-determining protein MinD